MSTRGKMEVCQWTKFIQSLVLPSTCISCGKRGGPSLDLCAACEALLPVLAHCCRRCGLALPPQTSEPQCGQCLHRDNPVIRTVAALAYQDPVNSLIGRFKYERKLHLGRTLTQLLASKIHDHYQREELPELLIPVPLHHSRLRQRGYNQAQLIAGDLAEHLHLPVAANLVQRMRATPAQQGLRARERKRNLRGAFATTSHWQAIHCTRIALVDDVVTTMSTVLEIADVLQQDRQKPLEVHVWCLARA